MAKKVRLTKKEVLNMFREVDFYEHFKGTGRTESEIKALIDGFDNELRTNKKGEAVEREIIDRVSATFGEIFSKDIAVIDKRIVNSQFIKAEAVIERDKTQALLELFELAKSDIQEENRHDVELTSIKENLNATGARVAQDQSEEIQDIIDSNSTTIDKLRAELSDKLAHIDELRATARREDEISFYIDKYEEEYKETLNFFGRLGYPKSPSKRADLLKAYIEQRIEEEKIVEGADGTVRVSNAVSTAQPHTLYDISAEHQGPQERALEESIKKLRLDIRRLNSENKKLEEEQSVVDTDRNAQEEAVKKCQEFIDEYNGVITDCNQNITTIASLHGELINKTAEITEYTGSLRSMRIEVAQEYLDSMADDTNPLLILAYEGYIARLREQDRIANAFVSDANPELEEIIKNDLSLNSENYMEVALEHYICQGFGSGQFVKDTASIRKNATKYFGKYLTSIDKRYEDIVKRYEIAEKSFDYFTRQVLQTEYVGHNTTDKYNNRLAEEIEKNDKALDERVVSTRNRLEIINPDYDRVTRFTANPSVKRYMSLTMIREELVAKNNSQGLDAEEKEYLAVVSKEIDQEIEIAKRNGTLIDIANATQVAVETMIPGYDEVAEYAKMHGKDISDPVQRQELVEMQDDFRKTTILSQASSQDIALYANFVGADITTAEKRDAFIAKYGDKMVKFFESGAPVVHPSITKYSTLLHSEDGIEKLKSNPQQIVDMYKKFAKSGVVVSLDKGELYISTEKNGENKVKVSADRLLDPQFMVSTGMVLDLPQSSYAKYSKIGQSVPNISETFETRQKYVYGQIPEGKDLGLLGQASLYTAMDREVAFEEARKVLWDKYLSASALKKLEKQIKAEGQNGAGRDAKSELIEAYKKEYIKIYAEYEKDKQQFVEASQDSGLATPLMTRNNTEVAKEGHNEHYDEEIETPDKKTLYKGGKARTNELLGKVVAIADARREFESADEVGIEILNEGIAVAVVDMLTTLDKLKVTNPEVVSMLNKAIEKRTETICERPDEYSINIDENRNLSISIGEMTYSINEDRKVSIEQREATQTVPENPTV